jgi:hypothetical protein
MKKVSFMGILMGFILQNTIGGRLGAGGVGGGELMGDNIIPLGKPAATRRGKK